ncbi:MAG TPA: hypothetical protein VIJ51_03105 [Solirubrobacteraceae bacterium]
MAATDEQLATDDAWAGELASSRPRRRLLSPPTVILAIVLFAVVGFMVGVKVEKGQLSSSATGRAGAATGAAGTRRGGGAGGAAGTASGATGAAGAAAAGGFAGGGGFGGGGAASSAAGPVTTGTVSSTSGTTLYVQNSAGNTVPVNTTQSTQVTRTVDATPSEVHPGETVVVQGTTGPNGAINAVTIRSNATAAAALSGLTG